MASAGKPEPGPIEVVVRFAPTIIRWVREQQYFSLVAEERAPEGAGDMIMRYRPRDLAQIEGWLLSWGDEMEVLAPPELRDRMAKTAARILKKHRD